MDLFSYVPPAPAAPAYIPSYPDAPGFKVGGSTSEAAATSVEEAAPRLRKLILYALQRAGSDGLTADEGAAAIGESVLSVRPRFTELSTANLIKPTPERRKNASGRSAIVWVKA